MLLLAAYVITLLPVANATKRTMLKTCNSKGLPRYLANIVTKGFGHTLVNLCLRHTFRVTSYKVQEFKALRLQVYSISKFESLALSVLYYNLVL